jgi:hypothetical protein
MIMMMKRFSVVFCVSILGFATGCNPGTTGGETTKTTDPQTGTTVTSKKPFIGMPSGTFELSTPVMASSLKQGESKESTLTISRGENFSGDVAIKFAEIPMGVSIKPVAPEIKHGDDSVVLTVSAAEDAALGDFSIQVIGHPAKGTDSTNKLKVSIAKK